jgi:hypothetical protein
MASIRRTLSPVPRPVALQNGEVCSVASPLSRSSSSPQHYPPDGGLLSSLFGSLDSQAFVFGILSPRSSRPLERSKPRAQMWRRSLFHFFICFMVGVFMGLTPFASMNLSMNPMSKHQSFSFEVISTVGDFQSHENVTRTVSRLDGGDMRRSATLKSEVEDLELIDETHEDKFDTQPLSEDSNLVSRKLLIIVTPTNAGPFQAYDLIRLAQSLKLVPSPLLWIVVEMTSQSAETADILRRTGVMYRHLVCYKNLTDINDAYIHQRNVALSHIETHRLDGIVYFADDNNVNLADLFEQMRQIRYLRYFFFFFGLKTVMLFFYANEALYNLDTFYLGLILAKKRKIMIRLSIIIYEVLVAKSRFEMVIIYSIFVASYCMFYSTISTEALGDFLITML